MKYKYILAGLFISAISLTTRAQEAFNYEGALSKDAYFENPREYLSELDYQYLKTGILLDHVLYTDYIFGFNGKSRVSVGNHKDFKMHYQQIRLSHVDTNLLPKYPILESSAKNRQSESNTYTISVLDYDYERINKNEIGTSFVEGNEKLNQRYYRTSQFKTGRLVNFSLGSDIILGQGVNFKLDRNFYFDNHQDKEIINIEIDFGNGEGYKRINLDETKSISFPELESFYEAKLKVTYKNNSTNLNETVYAHFNFYVKTHQVDFYQKAYSGSFNGAHKSFIYPNPTTVEYQICRPIRVFRGGFENQCMNFTDEVTEPYSLQVDIILNTENESGKLRKAFIMVDGFDPGNKRNIYRTDVAPDALPRDRDNRGLFEMLDGQPSPWTNTSISSGFIAELQARGFDIVFIDFLEGAGSIQRNAAQMRNLFNNVLNSPEYRDNETQEHILVGPSMGGLITRMMLTLMEKYGEQHFVKQWISFDSPHKGANVPLAVQHLLSFMHDVGLGETSDKIELINNEAAKSMLLHHYSQLENSLAKGHPNFIQLQNELSELGYPTNTLNYAISNGGEEKLYDGRNQILKFDIELRGQFNKPWMVTIAQLLVPNFLDNLDENDIRFNGYNWDESYGDNYSQTFYGKSLLATNQDIKYRNQFNIDNCPGGWGAFTYAANYNPKNMYDQPDLNSDASKIRTINSFIPVCSAFGITPDKDSVKLFPSQFTNINDIRSGKIVTPFDDILGMERNEEHVRISPFTRDHVFTNWIDPENRQTTRPVIRRYKQNTQKVNQPVGYIVTDSISYAENSNEFIFENGADSKIQSGRNITFHPGFSALKGAKIFAYIDEETEINHILKSGSAITPEETFSAGSPFENKSYDYSEIEKELEPAEVSSISVAIYPNPGSSEMNILLDKVANKNAEVRVYNMTGVLMYTTSTTSAKLNIDVNSWANGVYLVEVQSEGNTETVKYTKI